MATDQETSVSVLDEVLIEVSRLDQIANAAMLFAIDTCGADDMDAETKAMYCKQLDQPSDLPNYTLPQLIDEFVTTQQRLAAFASDAIALYPHAELSRDRAFRELQALRSVVERLPACGDLQRQTLAAMCVLSHCLTPAGSPELEVEGRRVSVFMNNWLEQWGKQSDGDVHSVGDEATAQRAPGEAGED